MTRDEALALVREFVKNEGLVRHMLSVEAAMRFYAEKYGEDVEQWGLIGLLHDFDWEIHPTLDEHPQAGAPMPPALRIVFPENNTLPSRPHSFAQPKSRCKRKQRAQTQARIKHIARRLAQFDTQHRQWRGQRAPTANKTHPIRFKARKRCTQQPMHQHREALIRPTRATLGQ